MVQAMSQEKSRYPCDSGNGGSSKVLADDTANVPFSSGRLHPLMVTVRGSGGGAGRMNMPSARFIGRWEKECRGGKRSGKGDKESQRFDASVADSNPAAVCG